MTSMVTVTDMLKGRIFCPFFSICALPGNTSLSQVVQFSTEPARRIPLSGILAFHKSCTSRLNLQETETNPTIKTATHQHTWHSTSYLTGQTIMPTAEYRSLIQHTTVYAPAKQCRPTLQRTGYPLLAQVPLPSHGTVPNPGILRLVFSAKIRS